MVKSHTSVQDRLSYARQSARREQEGCRPSRRLESLRSSFVHQGRNSDRLRDSRKRLSLDETSSLSSEANAVPPFRPSSSWDEHDYSLRELFDEHRKHRTSCGKHSRIVTDKVDAAELLRQARQRDRDNHARKKRPQSLRRIESLRSLVNQRR